MAEHTRPTIEARADADMVTAEGAVLEARATEHLGDGIGEILELLEERLTVCTRRLPTGTVRVGTRTETVEATAEAALDRYRVEVTRVPVGRVVGEVPEARAEGDTTIIPVVEERLVVVKQIFLIEEVRIRHLLEREAVREPVTLRRQHAVVERLDPNVGTDTDEATSTQDAAQGAEGVRHGSAR